MLLQEKATSELRQAIIFGTLKPGEKLSEPELAQHFQTSRSPIREALVQLEQEGFVERSSTGRVAVRALNIEEAEQLFIVRATLEGLATRLAVENLTRRDTQKLKSNIEGMQQAGAKREFGEALELGADFHRIIIEACNNKPLQDCLVGFRARTSRYRHIVASLEEFSEQRINEHNAILAALLTQSPQTAEQAMINHILVSSRETIAALKRYLESPVIAKSLRNT
ncbi:GntR family transcriptional regulator [Ferrovibrio sp.]|uniref:GntR family transcriptional regulator n=1 Tax=Ferrovibrio sp. TaxID=1917215 RepID=UPI000CCA6450|nr:GntR family transcriptional regulator [Ferrovibrio sp.]PJI42179.1 MAG: hypothetical protein CTR53_07005 [Ferrovibrio sp.]